jgi:hypothetical protein
MKLLALLLASVGLHAQQYFPTGVLANDSQYSKYLHALREPSLWELSKKDPHAVVYRFLWLRTFHHPVAIRVVVHPNGSGRINARMTSGRGGYEPGGIRRYSTSWLRKGLTQEFLAALEAAHFWDLPTVKDVGQLDGAEWIFEGVRNGQYRVIDRRAPADGDPLRAVGILLLKLARFRIHPAEMY